MIIICDIDGVLADCSHRLHYKDEKDYDNFYGILMADDKVIEAGRKLYNTLNDKSYEKDAVFLTGRPERTRAITDNWLKAHCLHANNIMLMRKDDDHRKSPEVKVDLVKEYFKKLGKQELKRHEVIYFIDDDPENVKAVCKAFPQITGITFGIKRM